jgi:hypothetical protein
MKRSRPRSFRPKIAVEGEMNERSPMVRVCVLGLLGLASCIADLRPDVGPRLDDDEESTDPSSNDGEGDGDAPDDESEPGDDQDETPSGDDPDGGAGPGDDDGDDGPPEEDAGVVDNGCAVRDSDQGSDVSFVADVMPIQAECRCHNPNSDDPFAILESGLTIDGYASLRAGGYEAGTDIVVDGNACESVMLQKLSETPPFGERMPLMGPYLSAEQRRVISDWIVEGAREN